MSFIKKQIKKFLYFSLRILGGKNFSNDLYGPFALFKFLIVQKFFRVNHHVPWPVHWTSQVKCPEKIQKGTRNPGMALCCYLDGRNGIIVGKNVWIGPRVSIISQNHNTNNYHKYKDTKPIKIGDNCWLATNAVILPGVELGNHVVVAAGAVVTESFKQDNILLGGVPAKIIKKLNKYEANS
mgnify:CR=1 FL=1